MPKKKKKIKKKKLIKKIKIKPLKKKRKQMFQQRKVGATQLKKKLK